MTASKISRSPAINILILAASKIPIQQAQFSYPICLTEINGASLLERIVHNTQSIDNAKLVFSFLETEAQDYHLDKVVSLLTIGASVIWVPEETKGSACTALLAACQLDQEAELLIISANELVDDDLGVMVNNFRERNLDAGTLTFHSVHPRYSFVSLGDDGLVIETAQRRPISSNATAGVFWYARTGDFVDGTQSLIHKNSCVEDSYFVATVFNELVLKQKKVGVSLLALDKYIPLKTEQQIDRYEGSRN
tara:strand:- start:2853 stop:3605 length:753 start_codon:yes stop_codon:yes gene_type:complete